MTVQELIIELQKFDGDLPVEYTGSWGAWSVESVKLSKGKYRDVVLIDSGT
jgi:hypothetical protein